MHFVYENQLGIKENMIIFFYLCCSNTGTKFRELCHSNHMIPHRGKAKLTDTFITDTVSPMGPSLLDETQNCPGLWLEPLKERPKP